ncbi:lipid-transfer protein [Sinimarinibacterium sp. CAU 1509]|uniref:thiolase C-terminal domain-containing protein n=1 Tax=Sinimarinibacterium sp. CAU 1509 TaxID=2562283 RepID=UPI0010ACA2C9|nr:lipid-transfer protein [Sinimarinibacterium sp. CAU 1509]TJY58933.1 lipid-transfer protein [Sinimarinibacterium sp. CAU 1509]
MARTFTEAAIAGIGATEFSKESGRSELQLAAECSLAACEDAGVNPHDIDGMITFTIDNSDEIGLARCLGVKDLAYTTRIPGGGAAAAATIYQAMALVNAGLCNNVLIWRAMNERSQYRFGQNPNNMQGYTGGHGTGSLLWCIPYGAMTPASWGALQGARYMHTYGISNRDLGYLAVQQRAYAATNPKAWFYERPITLEDHQNSKWIQEPWLRLLDCCQESDGGVAILVTSLERARDLKQPPVKIVGACQSIPYNVEVISNYYHDDLTIMPEAWGTAKRLYAQTGMKPTDMQAAMIYDAFSPQVLMQLEAFGFCGKGEAAEFIKSGAIAIDGQLPINTHGGLAGEAYIHGMNSMAEGVRQVRGSSVNQVKDVTNVLVSSGMASAIFSKA